MFERYEGIDKDAKKFRDNLKCLVEAITKVQQSDAENFSAIIEDSDRRNDAVAEIRQSIYIKRILYRANLIINDGEFLRYCCLKNCHENKFDQNMRLLGECPNNMFIFGYKEARKEVASKSKKRNQKFINSISVCLIFIAMMSLLITILAWIVFAIVIASLANPAVAIAVGEIFLSASFYGGFLGMTGAMLLFKACGEAWISIDSKIETWKQNRIWQNYTKIEYSESPVVQENPHAGRYYLLENQLSDSEFDDMIKIISEEFARPQSEHIHQERRSLFGY